MNFERPGTRDSRPINGVDIYRTCQNLIADVYNKNQKRQSLLLCFLLNQRQKRRIETLAHILSSVEMTSKV